MILTEKGKEVGKRQYREKVKLGEGLIRGLEDVTSYMGGDRYDAVT